MNNLTNITAEPFEDYDLYEEQTKALKGEISLLINENTIQFNLYDDKYLIYRDKTVWFFAGSTPFSHHDFTSIDSIIDYIVDYEPKSYMIA